MAQVKHLDGATAEVVAAPAEDDRVEAIGQNAGNQDLALPVVEKPTDQVIDHAAAGSVVPAEPKANTNC
jgi:hypothetical protein